MKVAILHDYLNQWGGAERVTETLLELFPKADLYTLFYDEKKLKGKFKNNLKRTSFLDCSFVRNHHRFCILLMPLAAQTLTIDNGYDLVISSSAGYAKGFNICHRHGHSPFHTCYCHTPLRYAWEKKYLKDLPLLPKLISKTLGNPVRSYLKNWDTRASKKVNIFIANSNFIAQKIKKYYGRDAQVIYPPVGENFFYKEEPREDFYLMAGRLIYYKRFDLGIRACEHLKKKLKIAGTGPEEKKLRKSANPEFIEFAGNVGDNELRALYNRAKALIFPQEEDFGLVAAEAQACGLPVIAYHEGGAREIIREGETGMFFREQTIKNLAEAIRKFENMNFERDKIVASARRFSKQVFKDKMKSIILKFLNPES